MRHAALLASFQRSGRKRPVEDITPGRARFQCQRLFRTIRGAQPTFDAGRWVERELERVGPGILSLCAIAPSRVTVSGREIESPRGAGAYALAGACASGRNESLARAGERGEPREGGCALLSGKIGDECEYGFVTPANRGAMVLSLIHISEPTRPY